MVSPPALLPLICSPAVALAVKVVGAASCTASMPVILLPIVAVPPPFTVSVLMPVVPPVMVTLASVAAATVVAVVAAAAVHRLAGARRYRVVARAEVDHVAVGGAEMVMPGDVSAADGVRGHVHRRVQPGAQRHRLRRRASPSCALMTAMFASVFGAARLKLPPPSSSSMFVPLPPLI